MGTHMKVLGESFPMNTNMTGFQWLSMYLRPCNLDERSLSIRRVKPSEAAVGINGFRFFSSLESFMIPICVNTLLAEMRKYVMCKFVLLD